MNDFISLFRVEHKETGTGPFIKNRDLNSNPVIIPDMNEEVLASFNAQPHRVLLKNGGIYGTSSLDSLKEYFRSNFDQNLSEKEWHISQYSVPKSSNSIYKTPGEDSYIFDRKISTRVKNLGIGNLHEKTNKEWLNRIGIKYGAGEFLPHRTFESETSNIDIPLKKSNLITPIDDYIKHNTRIEAESVSKAVYHSQVWKLGASKSVAESEAKGLKSFAVQARNRLMPKQLVAAIRQGKRFNSLFDALNGEDGAEFAQAASTYSGSHSIISNIPKRTINRPAISTADSAENIVAEADHLVTMIPRRPFQAVLNVTKSLTTKFDARKFLNFFK